MGDFADSFSVICIGAHSVSLAGKFILEDYTLGRSFLVSVGIVIGMRYVSSHSSHKKFLLALMTIGLGGAMVVFYFLDLLLPKFIALDCPSTVSSTTTLQGRAIDPRWRIYVLIRPRRAYGSFVNPVPQPGEDGTWYATCAFGGGDGEQFEVSALALSSDVTQPRPDVPPDPQWLEDNALCKTSICVVTKR